MADLRNLRKAYEKDALDEERAAHDPLAQFGQWMQQALDAKVPEPNAMTVATTGADGRPSTRIVLIKSFDAAGIVWFTNYDSRKGRELAAHPVAALQFHWVEMERVVRIEGKVSRVDASRIRRVLRQPAAGVTDRRLGFRAEPPDHLRGRCWWRALPNSA
jgi:pyridoxamine 5'-phosphate oxidase